MKTIFTLSKTAALFLGILFTAKAEAPKEILAKKMKSEALTYFIDHQYEEALNIYLQLENKTDEKGEIHYMIGMCLMSVDKSKALPYLISAEESKQTSFVVNYYLGRAYLDAKQYDQAIHYLEIYNQELAKMNGLVFKKYCDVPANHLVHYEKSNNDVAKAIEICKNNLYDNVAKNGNKGNSEMSTLDNENIVQGEPIMAK